MASIEYAVGSIQLKVPAVHGQPVSSVFTSVVSRRITSEFWITTQASDPFGRQRYHT